jgi:hypothetical protein
MNHERRLLQAAVALASLVPIGAGIAGMVLGPILVGDNAALQDMGSHFRYLSGLLAMIGLLFLSTVPRIETHGARFRLLGTIVVMGGVGRALGWITEGPPGGAHRAALIMELAVVPLLMLWQARVARETPHI